MNYEVIFRPSVKKDIRRIPRIFLRSIQDALKDLRADPFPATAKRLTGYTPPLYRIRIGRFRIVYEVDTEIRIIGVIRIRDRKEAYREL